MPDPAKVWQRVNTEEQAIQTGSNRTIGKCGKKSRPLPLLSTCGGVYMAPLESSNQGLKFLHPEQIPWVMTSSPFSPTPSSFLLLLLFLNPHSLENYSVWTQHAKICTITDKLLQESNSVLSGPLSFLAKHDPEDINIHSRLCQAECLTLNLFNFSLLTTLRGEYSLALSVKSFHLP